MAGQPHARETDAGVDYQELQMSFPFYSRVIKCYISH